MVASIALGFILRYSIGAAWGWEPLYFSIVWPTSSLWSRHDIGALAVTNLWLWLIVAAVALSLGARFLAMNTKAILNRDYLMAYSVH
jgi:hypothetical protein